MLAHLHVKNLALIEEIEVEFGPGLNILTGETGAGKSILLGSMQLILGAKTSKNMIRVLRNRVRSTIVRPPLHLSNWGYPLFILFDNEH